LSPILVLDVSATLPWCYEDEMNDASAALLDRIAVGPVLVPALWCVELGNALLQGERRKRITSEDIARFLALLDGLPIETDHDLDHSAVAPLVTLARQHRLTGYDAAYLSLALRRDLPLATRDGALQRAAVACGVTLTEA
jgi:predicted nucleic acid-binding protein